MPHLRSRNIVLVAWCNTCQFLTWIWSRSKNEAESSQSKKEAKLCDSLDPQIIESLRHTLDAENELVKLYRKVRDRFKANELDNVRLKLIGKQASDERNYNLPTSSEVAALIVGDIEDSLDKRDIVIETKT
ncbi:hypothetical protein Tco_1001586, partial [Tanacetum coccineum]